MAGSVGVEESRQWLEVLVWRSPDNGWKCWCGGVQTTSRQWLEVLVWRSPDHA